MNRILQPHALVAHSPAWRLASLATIFLALVGGAWIQSEILLGSDLGWLIRSVRLMYEGQRFGVDIIEPNIPVTWYLCMPAAWGIEFLGLHEIDAIRLWIWILAGMSLLVARACILRSADRSYALLAELAAAAVAVCILVGSSFGQREHFAMLLSIPYLFVVRLRATGTAMDSRSAILAGAFAGIAFSIKPIFAVVPLAVEFLTYAWRRRRWPLIRPETVALAVAGCISFFGAIAMSPEYLSQVVPVTYATYWAYDSPLSLMLQGYPVVIVVFLAWIVAAMADIRAVLAPGVWLMAFFAWSVSYFFQHRGFDYHGHPAMVCAFVLSIAMLAILVGKLFAKTGVTSGTTAIGKEKLMAIAAVAMLLITARSLASETYYWVRAAHEEWQFSIPANREKVVRFLDSTGVVRGKSVFVFSTNPFPAFPTLNYLDAEWVGPDMAQYLLPAWMRKEEVPDADRIRAIDEAMAVQRRHVHRAIVEGKPDVILIDSWSRSGSRRGRGSKRIDYIAIFGADAAVAGALDRYHKIAELRGVQVYVRND